VLWLALFSKISLNQLIEDQAAGWLDLRPVFGLIKLHFRILFASEVICGLESRQGA